MEPLEVWTCQRAENVKKKKTPTSGQTVSIRLDEFLYYLVGTGVLVVANAAYTRL